MNPPVNLRTVRETLRTHAAVVVEALLRIPPKANKQAAASLLRLAHAGVASLTAELQTCAPSERERVPRAGR